MTLQTAPLLTTLIALAAMFLGLAVLVQIVQEIYKFLTSSKSRAYLKSVNDALGPLARDALRSDRSPQMKVRGPLQLFGFRRTGWLLPMNAGELENALVATAPPWRCAQAFQDDGRVVRDDGVDRQRVRLVADMIGDVGAFLNRVFGYLRGALVACREGRIELHERQFVIADCNSRELLGRQDPYFDINHRLCPRHRE